LEENAPEGSSAHVSLGSKVPLPCVVKVTVPAGGTRAASGPESVTVGTQEDAVPGESPFGVQLIESVVGFAATATSASPSRACAAGAIAADAAHSTTTRRNTETHLLASAVIWARLPGAAQERLKRTSVGRATR
jgi:hypothetical protein